MIVKLNFVKKACVEKVVHKNLFLNLSIRFIFMQKHEKETTCLMLFIWYKIRKL